MATTNHLSAFLIIFLVVFIAIRDLQGSLYESFTNPQVAKGSEASGTPTIFDAIVQQARQDTVQPMPSTRPEFSLSGWSRGGGGLSDKDRLKLGEIYRQANSVFEYGLGESTKIAHAVQVPRYAGIDSDAVWIANARKSVSPHFRFYLGDLGTTREFGYPVQSEAKNPLQYQLAPLLAEDQAFDVYMIDGRYRMACLLAALLHASARGADPSHTIVLMHDCVVEGISPDELYNIQNRPQYRLADHLLDRIDHSGDALCVYKRKPTATDEDLQKVWMETYLMPG